MICTHILLCSAMSLSFVLRLRPPHWRGCLSCCFLSLLRSFSFFFSSGVARSAGIAFAAPVVGGARGAGAPPAASACFG